MKCCKLQMEGWGKILKHRTVGIKVHGYDEF
jgi:hypothetical protein